MIPVLIARAVDRSQVRVNQKGRAAVRAAVVLKRRQRAAARQRKSTLSHPDL